MKTVSPTSTRPHRGQTLIFMLMMMVILTFVAFSVYDTQHVIVQRVRAQNSSDSAALTGARWQLSCLNAIGEINLMKVTTEIVTEGPTPFGAPYDYDRYPLLFSALDKLQARIAITGPMLGVLYAEQAAKLNGMHVVPDYGTRFLRAIQFWEENQNDPSIVNDPWLSWPVFDPNNPADMQERQQLLADYFALCREIASEGLAAMPNIWGDSDEIARLLVWEPPDCPGARWLVDRAFYGAVVAHDWCYLKPLVGWGGWEGVAYRNTTGNGLSPFCFLSLQLSPWRDPYMGQLVGSLDAASQNDLNNIVTTVQSQLISRNLTQNQNWLGGNNWPRYGYYGDGLADTNATVRLPRFDQPGAQSGPFATLNWAIYTPNGQSSSWYGQWDPSRVNQLLNGSVRANCNYSYKNADSVWISQAAASVTMAVPKYGQANTSWTAAGQSAELSGALGNLWQLRTDASSAGYGIVASAAARSFGSFDDNTPPTQIPGGNGAICRIVMPVFTDVRLIPLAFSSAGGSFDPGWMEHVVFHLPDYTQQGKYTAGCMYCDELRLWDTAVHTLNDQFWTQNPNYPCPVGGGGGSGGGPNH